MKIAHAQLYMYTNILYKFQSSTCKTVGEKLQTKLCPWTHGRTAMAIPVYPPPLHCGGYNEGPNSYQSKDMANVKVFAEKKKQRNGRAKNYMAPVYHAGA